MLLKNDGRTGAQYYKKIFVRFPLRFFGNFPNAKKHRIIFGQFLTNPSDILRNLSDIPMNSSENSFIVQTIFYFREKSI